MKVIHDGDAAYEDIMALSLLLLNAEVMAVTVAYGESTTKMGAQNMERVCRMLKPSIKIPVAYGINVALDYHGTPFPDFIHKEADTILDHTDVPAVSDSKVTDSAVKLIYDTLKSSHEKITIVATGPLTNIAQLILEHPDCIEKIERLVIMGGAVKVPGNISDLIPDTQNFVAEWNIFADPKAADIVFTAQHLPITLVPIDITCQMPMTREFYTSLDKEVTPSLKLVKDMLTTLLKNMGEDIFYSKLQFWDSLSAMIALNASIATFEEMNIVIDLNTSQTKIAEASCSQIGRTQVATRIHNVKEAYHTFLNLMKTGEALALTSASGSQGYSGTLFGESKPTLHLENQKPSMLNIKLA